MQSHCGLCLLHFYIVSSQLHISTVGHILIRRLSRSFRFRLRRNKRLIHSADDLCGRLDGVIRVDGHLTVLAVVAEIVTLDRLVDKQILRKAGQKIGVLAQQRLALGIRLIEDVLDFFVDRGGSLLGVALRRSWRQSPRSSSSSCRNRGR